MQLFDTLSKFYKVDIKGNVASGLKQRDGTSCGPLTIENLINAALHHVINGFANVLDIRAQHVYLMNTFAPEHYFDVRQLHNLPSFQFDQQYNQIQKNLSSNHNQAVDDETILANIAENYKQRNTIPQLNKQELLAYLLKAIEKAQSAYALQQSAEVLKYLTALSALSKALQENYSKFVEENTGIPWDELSNLVRDINLHYEPSHGIAGHVILPNKRAYSALDFRKELIVEIIKDLEELQLSFKALAEFEYLEQKIPIANRIKTISNYLAEEVGLELLQKGVMVCSGLKLNTSEDRVFCLRQLALIGEAFVQLPGYLLKHFNINFVNFCKIIRNAIDHFETEFIQSNPGDKELKAIVFWLKNFIETGNYNNPPARLAKSAILDLINNPGGIEHYIIPILQTILTAQEPLSNFTPSLLEKPADLSYSFIADLNIKVILMQQEMLSYGLEIHNPISLPEDCDIATFHPVRSVQYYSGLVDRKEQAIISQLSKLYHANREFYQILIGSYARALLDNEVFMAYASERLYTTLHHLRAGRGYLGHNTEPNLGKGEDIETHSSNIAYTLIKELLSIIPELLTLQLILTDDDIKFVDGVRNLHSQYHSKMAGNSVEVLLQKILSRTIDIAPKESLASHDWLTGDQIAGIGDTMNTAIPFIPSVDGHLNPVAHGAIEPMIRDNLTNAITAAINVSPNVDVNSDKGNHWIFYFATQGTDGVMHGVLLNPMGNHLYDLTMQSIQARMIAAYGGPNRAQIKIHNLGMQTDSYNCGVWVLWFLEQINQLQQQGITIDEIFVHNLPDILKGLNIADINAKRAEYKAMLDASNESQHTASCSEEGRSTNKDKKDDEDEDDGGFSRPHSTKDNVGQNSLTIQTTSLTEASKTSSTNSGNTSGTTNTKTAAIILETRTFDEKLSNQLNYYLEHGVMFDSLRQTINQNDIIPEQHLAYISNTYISYAVGMLIFCSLSTVSDYSSIHKSEGYDGHFNVLPCLLGMTYDSIIPNIY